MDEVLVFSNRDAYEEEPPISCFGEEFHEDGPNHLQAALFQRESGRAWSVTFLNNQETEQEFLRIARDIQSLILYVHGFNTSWESCLDTYSKITQFYGKGLVAFSWPSTGGVSASLYRIDKERAKLSAKAMDFFFRSIHYYLQKIQEIQERITVNLVTFSMGSYILENVIKQASCEEIQQREEASSIFIINQLANNILLASPDVNNPGHELWCSRLSPRRGRVYVTLNSEDLPLKLSELLGGSEQRPRLGRSPMNLKCRNIIYLNLTNLFHLGNIHRNFLGEVPVITKVFQLIFKGMNPLESDEVTFKKNHYSPQVFHLKYCPRC